MRALAWVVRWVTAWWPQPKGQRMPQITAVHVVEGNTVIGTTPDGQITVGPQPWVSIADGSTAYIAGTGWRIEWYGGDGGTLPASEIPIYLQLQVYPVGSDPTILYRPMDDAPGASGGASSGPFTTIHLGDFTDLRDQWVTLDPILIPGEHVWVYEDEDYWPTWRTEIEFSAGTLLSYIALVEFGGVPYRRITNRKDAFAGGARRVGGTTKTIQGSNRRGPGAIV